MADPAPTLDLEAAVMTCCECGAQMVSSSGIDALSPLVEPYRVRARDAEERADAAEARLAELEAENKKLDGRRREGRQLLSQLARRLRKLAPGDERLRLVEDYIGRTAEPSDILRARTPEEETEEDAGDKPSVETKACPECSGTGDVVYAGPSSGATLAVNRACPECRGTGRIPATGKSSTGGGEGREA